MENTVKSTQITLAKNQDTGLCTRLLGFAPDYWVFTRLLGLHPTTGLAPDDWAFHPTTALSEGPGTFREQHQTTRVNTKMIEILTIIETGPKWVEMS